MINSTFYFTVSERFDREYCTNSTITKINNQGSILFVYGDERY